MKINDYASSELNLKDALDIFADLIERRAEEKSFQQLFTKYPFILSESLPVRVAPIDIIPMGTPGKSEPDFIFYPKSDKNPGNFGVIEIKRPDSIIATVTRKNIVTLSRDAETAVSQSEFYLHNISESTLVKPQNSLILGNKGWCFVIIGLSTQLQKVLINDSMVEQLERRIPTSCRLLPYDIVFNNIVKNIDTKVYFLFSSAEQYCRIGILDESETNIYEIFLLIIDKYTNIKAKIYNEIDTFLADLRNQEFELPVITYNPEIYNPKELWAEITSFEHYQNTPILLVYNNLGYDPKGEQRIGESLRLGLDSKIEIGDICRIQKSLPVIRSLAETRIALALKKRK
jgi:hypothetical protein